MFVIYIFCSQASRFRVMPHGVKSPGSIAKRKAAREGKQRTGFVEPVVELAKVPSEMVELAKVPRECEAELVMVPVEEETAKFPCVVDVEENAKISWNLQRFQVRWWNLQRFHVNVRRNL